MENLKFKNGDLMPIIGLGTWKAGTGEIYKSVRDALKMGYRHFDCAHIYGNEVEIGEALADAIKEGEVTREELWITSKLWNDAHEPHRVGEALQVTLDALQTNYLDLYLMH